MEDGKIRFYGFGEFRVDSRRRILLKNDKTIALSPRNFDLLLFLIEKEGQILSHDDLLDRVWEGTFVEQANLKNAISVLRRVLGEAPNESFYIRTVPRRGYSFVAPVTAIEEERGETSDSPNSGEFSRPHVSIDQLHKTDDTKAEVHLSANENRSQLPSTPLGKKKLLTARNFGILTALLLICVFTGIAARAWFFGTKAIQYTAENVNIFKITSEGNLVGGGASISPNGKYLVYVVQSGESRSLWTRQIVTGISRQISPNMQGSVYACVLTPDEDFIYYVFKSFIDNSKSGLFKISTFGGTEQRIGENTGGAIAIAPDGKRLAVVNNDEKKPKNIETMGLDGGDNKVIWNISEDVRVWDMKYSPDGNGVIVSIRRQLADKAVYSVIEIPSNGGVEKVLIPEQEKQIANIALVPDRQSVLVGIRELNAEIRQIWQYFISSGEWKRVSNDNASYRGISLTKDGKTLVTSQESRNTTLWVSPTGNVSDLTQIKPGTHYLIAVGWTQDSRLVYSTVENTAEKISIINADGSGDKTLTAGDDGIWLFPSPVRNGREIVYSSLHAGRRQLWKMNFEGRNNNLLLGIDDDIYDGDLLSDGITTIYLNVPNKTIELAKSGVKSRILLEHSTGTWAVSPDETMLAAECEDPVTKKLEVRLIRIDTGASVTKFNFSTARALEFTPDGKDLAFDVIDGEGGKIMLQPIDGGEQKPLISLKSEEVFSFGWSADGSKFALIRGKHLTDAAKITVGVDH